MSRGGKRPGAGRKPGSKTKVGADLRANIREFLQGASLEVAQNLAARLINEDEPLSACVSGWRVMMEYGFGPPAQAIQITPASGEALAALAKAVSDDDASRAYAELLEHDANPS